MVFYTTGREFESLMRRQCWADSLMVKQSTHNRLSESSILSQPTSYVGGTSWMGTGLQIHGSRFDSCHLLQDIFVLQKFL
jgi:hypothetical protein